MNLRAVLPVPGVRLGLSGCVAITALAAMLAAVPALSANGLGWLPLAVALGMFAGNLWPQLPAAGAAGIALARGPLMRTGIVLYGLRIGADEIALVGWPGIVMAAFIVASTLGLAIVVGRRLGVERDAALLVGAGSAICGAAAIAAADGVVGARARQVSAAVAVVVVFGTLGMYLLPLVRPLVGNLVGLSDAEFGLWIGLTVHELGHVVAAGSAVGEDAAATALIEKMLRVMLLAPAVVGIAFLKGRDNGAGASGFRMPVFLWGFLAAIALNLGGALPSPVQAAGAEIAQLLLAFGLAALGAATRFSDIRQAGGRIWALAIVLWIHLLVSAFAVICVFGWLR